MPHKRLIGVAVIVAVVVVLSVVAVISVIIEDFVNPPDACSRQPSPRGVQFVLAA